ncbi:MAG TPA: TetR/AcrR family transcriptional regulator [Dehalococcoidia bacterium]|nr:TetR/AcrR family transcriptional regulator [Dehalococcoidia bacterium]
MRGKSPDCKRDHLLSTAKELFARQGYPATTVSQLVQQAGIARGTFYLYFDNKLHLFQHILDSFLEDLEACVKPIILGPGVPPPLVQVEHNLRRVLDLALRERELTQILMQHTSATDSTIGKRLNDFYRRVAGMMEHSLELGISMKLVRPCNTHLVAYAVLGGVKEVIFQITSSEGFQLAPEALVQELLNFSTAGVYLPGTGSPYGSRLPEPKGELQPKG